MVTLKIAADTETALIRPGLAAPPLACTTWAGEDLTPCIAHARESRPVWCKWLETDDAHLYGLNFAYDTAVVCAEFPDLFVPVCEAYLDLRMHDVGLDQRLIDICNGELDGRWIDNPDYDPALPTKGRNKPRRWRKNKYALAELALRLWGEAIAKGEDTWRLRYGTLIGTPLERWPADAVRYAMHDAVTTMNVHLWHCDNAEVPEGYTLDDVLGDSGAQAQAAFALHLMTCRGIRTDAAACRALIQAAEHEIDRCLDVCAHEGLVVQGRRGGWSKKLEPAREYMVGALLRGAGISDTAEARAWLLDSVRDFVETVDELPKDRHVVLEWSDEEGVTDVSVKLTKTGDISLDAEACKDVGDPVLRAYATYTSATSLRKKAKRMSYGAQVPLQTRFQPLVATGRTSSSRSDRPLIGDNFQNFRRNAMHNELGEELPGQRECIIARDRKVLCSIDGDNAEMRGEAQIAIWSEGYSNLADVMNRGEDAHLALAAAQLLTSPVAYERAQALLAAKDAEIKNARQFAKVPNFALLGGARAKTMIPYAKGMGIALTDDRAVQLYEAFHSQWPEIAPMHSKVKQALRAGRGAYVFEQWVSKRLRLVDRYTVGCNTGFQGLVADGFKSSLLWLALECYSGREYAIGADGWRIRPTGRSSALEGSYPVLFCHDEVIFELVDGPHLHEAAYRARDVMVQAINRWLPDVPITAEPCLMRRWYKSAETVKQNGRVVVWEPKQKAA